MSLFPTKSELEKIIADGKLCPSCEKNPAVVERHPFGGWMIGICEECRERSNKNYVPETPRMGSNRVHSIWEHPSGAKIPVNEKGNVIHGEPKYTKRKGQPPIW